MGLSYRAPLIAFAYLVVTSVSLGTQSTYRLTEIPTAGGCANGINNRGQVVGEIPGINGRSAFLWSTSTGIIDIGAIAGFYQSVAYDINNAGQIVGIKSYAPTPPFENGFLWDPVKGEVDLPDLPGGDVYTRANAIAEGGQVTGYSAGASAYHAVLWRHGAVMDLGDVPGGDDGSAGIGINDRGDVVGSSLTSSGPYAFLWTRQNGMVNLGALPGFTYASTAQDINNRGQVAGFSQSSTTVAHAVLWTPEGAVSDLGELPGGQELAIAEAINDFGEVVGYSTVAVPAGEDSGRAFLWENGSMYDLNSLVDPSDPLYGVLLLTQAHDINSRGQIVGCATNLVNGEGGGFLLTPRTGQVGLQ